MTLRIGILGAGFMGRTHAAGWARTPAQIAGFYAADAAQMHSLADQYRVQAFTDYDALLKAVDVVDICTPTYFHHEHVLHAAQAGKHVICEKPLGLTVTQAREMLAFCKKAGIKLLVAHVVRFFPEYAAAKAAVDRGEIGKVAVVRLTRCSFQPKLGADNWFLDPTRSGGMMLDLMVHDFDYARWIAGDVISVFARSIRGRTPDAPADYALAILRHRNGAISNVEGGWAYPPPMFRTALEIAGDAGLIEHPADSSTPLGVYLKQTGGSDSPEVGLPMSPMAEDPYTTQIKHFYEVLVNGAVPRVTGQDGLAAVEIARAAIESAQTGRQVTVGSVD
jgi:predicted dehydrogenase